MPVGSSAWRPMSQDTMKRHADQLSHQLFHTLGNAQHISCKLGQPSGGMPAVSVPSLLPLRRAHVPAQTHQAQNAGAGTVMSHIMCRMFPPPTA